MVTINNTNKEIVFQLKVEGSTLAETKGYLVLEFEQAQHRIQTPIYISTDTGHCKAELDLSLLKESKGIMSLEIITKDTVFTPWKQPFTVDKIKTESQPIVESKENKEEQIKKQALKESQIRKQLERKENREKVILLQESLNKMSKQQRDVAVALIAKKLNNKK